MSQGDDKINIEQLVDRALRVRELRELLVEAHGEAVDCGLMTGPLDLALGGARDELVMLYRKIGRATVDAAEGDDREPEARGVARMEAGAGAVAHDDCRVLREDAAEKVRRIQGHIEAGGANEELTAATVLCSELLADIDGGSGGPGADDEVDPRRDRIVELLDRAERLDRLAASLLGLGLPVNMGAAHIRIGTWRLRRDDERGWEVIDQSGAWIALGGQEVADALVKAWPAVEVSR